MRSSPALAWPIKPSLSAERFRSQRVSFGKADVEKYREQVDMRAFGTGERIVFLPYTREVFTQTQEWTEAHRLFDAVSAQAGYDEAALT